MAKYVVTVKVDQIVTKEVVLNITAGSEEEAARRATAALQTYPDKVEEEGVNRIVTTKSRYWIPRSIDIVNTKPEEPVVARD